MFYTNDSSTVDCSKDGPDVHPQNLCEICYAVLNKWFKVKLENIIHRKAHAYLPHSESCKMCFPSSSSPMNRPHELTFT